MEHEIVWFDRRAELRLGVVQGGGPRKLALLEEGGEKVRLPRDRVLHHLRRRLDAGSQAALRERLSTLRRELERQLEPPDPALLWESMEDERGYRFHELAQLYYGSTGDAEVAGIARALTDPESGRLTRHFKIDGVSVVRVDPETLAHLRERDEREQAEKAGFEAFVDWWRGIHPVPHEPGTAERLATLTRLALEGERCADSGPARRLARKLGLRDPDEVLEALEQRGVLPKHVNEVPHRRELPSHFSAAAGQEVEAWVAARPAPEGEDLRALPTIAVDDPGTHEVDDALSTWREEDGRRWVAVHIARPADLVRPGDALDREARRRATSVYFPGESLPMLPPALGAALLSLEQGEDRPALSLICPIEPDGLPGPGRFTRSVVRVDHQVTYTETGAGAELLEALLPVAEALHARRVAAGAHLVQLPQLKVRLDPDTGEPRPTLSPTDEPAQLVVSELMVLYNERAALALGAAGLPALFRAQPSPVAPRDLDPWDPLFPAVARRGLPPTSIQITPGPHRTMGVEAYLQATSPLRRYGDLLAQRQLLALLAGAPAPHEPEEVEALREALPPLERRARQAEEDRVRYLLYRWLELHAHEELPGVLVRADRRATVYLPAIDRELPAQLEGALEVGDRVQAAVERVAPRRRDVMLRARPAT